MPKISFEKLEALQHLKSYWSKMLGERRCLQIENPSLENERKLKQAIRNVSRLRKLRHTWRSNSSTRFIIKQRRYLILEEKDQQCSTKTNNLKSPSKNM